MSAIPRKFEGTELIMVDREYGSVAHICNPHGTPTTSPPLFVDISYSIVKQELFTLKWCYTGYPTEKKETRFEQEFTRRCPGCGRICIAPLRRYEQTREEYRLAETWASLRRMLGKLLGIWRKA